MMDMSNDALNITCPECGALAKFEEPFEFCSQKTFNDSESRPTQKWVGWIVSDVLILQ
jgi:hypothetical protein